MRNRRVAKTRRLSLAAPRLPARGVVCRCVLLCDCGISALTGRIALLGNAAGIFAAFGCILIGCRPPEEAGPGGRSRTSANATHRREIIALGRVRPLNGIVSVSAIPGARLAALFVSEGEEVELPGTSLGELASKELRTIEVVGLKNQLESAKQKLVAELAVAKARQEQATVAVARAKMERSQVDLKKGDVALLNERLKMATADFDRLEQLANDDPELVTKHELERRGLALKQLSSEFEQAEQTHDLAVKTSALGVEAAEADLKAADAAVVQIETSNSLSALEHKIAAAEVQARWTDLPAPCAGTVMRVFLQPGEFVARTPILQIADLSKMACVAEVYEADIQWIHRGDPVLIESSAFGGQYSTTGIRGRVARVGNLIGLPEIQSLNPMDRTDRHVVEVVVSVDPDDMKSTKEISRLVGLQVTVRFVNGETE